MKSKVLPVLLAAGTALAAAVAHADDMPVVPTSVLEAAKKGGGAPNIGAASVGQVNDNPVLTMQPGVNQVIPIATGHPNRIVTPFGTPEVVSTTLTGMNSNGECGEVCIKENVVYVATDKQHPVTMFITEKGTEAQALSVTMVPRRIPPREVFLKLDDEARLSGAMTFGNAKAEAWERSQPYIETIRSVFRGLALGDIPKGYSVGKMPRNAQVPRCDHPSLDVDFSNGQLMNGHSINVYIGVATNTSNKPVEFKESWCGGWDVAAIAVWPHNVLEPGQKTEVFVASKQSKANANTNKRRSLLD